MTRLALVLLMAFAIGWGLNRAAAALDRRGQPAGFARGLLQGALMPCAWPNLLLGYDVVIYSETNRGLIYKLGYTLGVNLCGAIFFGLFYGRLHRWRQHSRS